MTTNLNLKEIEKQAFRSTYQDGLRDIYYGLIIIFMAIFLDRPDEGFSALNIFYMVIAYAIVYLIFHFGKKYITIPRLGEVKFGEIRKLKKRTMVIVMSSFIFLQLILLGITFMAWLDPIFAQRLAATMGDQSIDLLLVSAIGSLIVGCGMILISYFSDFQRGYYIAILMAAAVFLILYFDNPVYPLIAGILILLPGLVLFVRFLRKYPLPAGE